MGNASSLTCENKSSFTITVVVFGVGIEEDEYDIKPGEEGQFIKYDKISFRISSGTSVIVNDADAGKYVIQDSLLNQNRLQCDHFEYDIDGEILSKVPQKNNEHHQTGAKDMVVSMSTEFDGRIMLGGSAWSHSRPPPPPEEKNEFYREIFSHRNPAINICSDGDKEQFKICSEVSLKAYDDQQYMHFQYFKKHSKHIQGDNYKRAWGICIKNQEAYLAFQGTVAPLDWLINVGMHPFSVALDDVGTTITVHSGFWVAVCNIFDEICVALEELSGEQTFDRIFITGHSQGGALAQLMYLKLCFLKDNHLASKVVGVYTFASPMIVYNAPHPDKLGCKIIEWQSKCKNAVLGMDIVPASPRLNRDTLSKMIERLLGGQIYKKLLDWVTGGSISSILKDLQNAEYRINYSPGASETFVNRPDSTELTKVSSDVYMRCVDGSFLSGIKSERTWNNQTILSLHDIHNYVKIFM